jgi:hypothetical protein
VPLARQEVAQQLAEIGIVVDDEQVRHDTSRAARAPR